MRKAITDNFLAAVSAAGRSIRWKILLRFTADRSLAHNEGTWVDVSDYISKSSFPSFTNSLEINLSQFSSSKTTLTGLDVNFWDSQVFSTSDEIEVRIDAIINELVADAITVFSGWIDKRKNRFVVKRSIRSGNCTFDVWSYSDYADKIHASTVTTQYVDDDLDALILPTIRGVYITDVSIASYVVAKGIHTISYRNDGVDAQAKVDDADYSNLISGANTLTFANGNQKVGLNVVLDELELGEHTCDFIVYVENSGSFPYTWHHQSSVRFLLETLLDKAGIQDVSFSTLEFPTKDGSKKVSFLDGVPLGGDPYARCKALENDGTRLWFGIDNRLYSRDMSSGRYTLVHTFSSGYNILRLIWVVGTSSLWIYTSAGYVYRYRSSTMSAGVNIGTDVYFASIHYHTLCNELVYNNYSTSKVRSVSDATMTDGLIGDGASGSRRAAFIHNSSTYYLADGNGFHKWDNDGTGWTDQGNIHLTVVYDSFAYHPNDGKVYFSQGPTFGTIYSTGLGSFSPTTVLTDTILGVNSRLFYSTSEDAVILGDEIGRLYALAADTATMISTGIKNSYYTLVDYDGRLYGVDVLGRLWQYYLLLACYASVANFDGLSVRGAIDKLCGSFELVYTISSNKSARVQHRADSDGNVFTSGANILLNADNAKDITDDSFYGDAFDIVTIKNGTKEISYDGSVFDAVAFLEEKVFPIDSELIPDEIIEDLAVAIYPFLSTPHKVLQVPSPAGMIHFECLDGATIEYSGTPVISASGVIVSDSIDRNGFPEFKILVNA